MTEILGWPLDDAIYLPVLGLAYFFCTLSPLWLSALVAVRNRNSMNRPFLFVTTMLLSTYGLLLLLSVVVTVPAWAFGVYVVPTMKVHGYFQGMGALLLWALDFLFKWWWAITPAFIFLSAIATTRYFSRRWNRIVEAL